MNARYFKHAASALVFLCVLSGCRIARPYQQPEIKIDSLFRDVTSIDTNTLASIPWSRMFKDAYLQTLLVEAVSNNYDLKIAVARIKQAESNLRQSRTAYIPGINFGAQVTQQKLSPSKGGPLF